MPTVCTALLDNLVQGREWQVAMASTHRDHVIVCGMGKIGREVVGIEMDPEGRFAEKAGTLNARSFLLPVSDSRVGGWDAGSRH